MSDHPAEQDLRPLLPRRNLGFGYWFSSRWFSTRRGEYDSFLSGGSAVETSGGSHESTRNAPVPSNATTAVMEGNGRSTAHVPDPAVIEIDGDTERVLQPAESSSMGGERTTTSDTVQRFLGNIRRGSDLNSVSSGNGTSQEKICLICLEPLSQEDFDRGDAMTLACECKGDAALRHKDCAQKWVDIKGDLTCDICRAPITNLNAPRPRSDAGSQQQSDDPTDASRGTFPSATDVFDCIRMTWVVTIVCILFFNLRIESALVAGLLIAVMYTWSCQLLRCAHHQVESDALQQTAPGHLVIAAEAPAARNTGHQQIPVPAIMVV